MMIRSLEHQKNNSLSFKKSCLYLQIQISEMLRLSNLSSFWKSGTSKTENHGMEFRKCELWWFYEMSFFVLFIFVYLTGKKWNSKIHKFLICCDIIENVLVSYVIKKKKKTKKTLVSRFKKNTKWKKKVFCFFKCGFWTGQFNYLHIKFMLLCLSVLP